MDPILINQDYETAGIKMSEVPNIELFVKVRPFKVVMCVF